LALCLRKAKRKRAAKEAGRIQPLPRYSPHLPMGSLAGIEFGWITLGRSILVQGDHRIVIPP
jgi:hypothetical protein